MNKMMRMGVSALAGTVLLGAILHWTGPRLLAQVRAALVQDVDNPARHFVQVSALVTQPSGSAGAGLCSNIYTVPAGQRLVIDNLGIRTAIANSGLATLYQTLTTSPVGCGSLSYFSSRHPIVLLPPLLEAFDTRGFSIYGNSQRVQAYADTSNIVSVEISTNVAFENGTFFDVVMSRHLVSYP